MPIRLVPKPGSYVKSGKMYGYGEIYIESPAGVGEVLSGFFAKGKLSGEGRRVVYGESGFIQYSGNFVDGVADGVMNILKYDYDGSCPVDGGDDGDGNGLYCPKDIAFAMNIPGRQISELYIGGVGVGPTSDVQVSLSVDVEKKPLSGDMYFCKFIVSVETP